MVLFVYTESSVTAGRSRSLASLRREIGFIALTHPDQVFEAALNPQAEQ